MVAMHGHSLEPSIGCVRIYGVAVAAFPLILPVVIILTSSITMHTMEIKTTLDSVVRQWSQ